MGRYDLTLGYKESSPGFELNDLGFQGPTDYRSATAFFGRRVNEPGRIFRDRSAYTFTAGRWNFAGDPTLLMAGAGANGTFQNTFWAGVEGNATLASYDDRLTRGGPIARRPGEYQISTFFGSPSRHRVSLNGNAQISGTDGGTWGRNASLNVDWRPSTAVRLQVGPNFSVRHGSAQYITAVTDAAADDTYGRRYVFGEIDQTTLGISTRLDWTFTRDLSLQLYAQPFVAAGRYDNFKEFEARAPSISPCTARIVGPSAGTARASSFRRWRRWSVRPACPPLATRTSTSASTTRTSTCARCAETRCSAGSIVPARLSSWSGSSSAVACSRSAPST
jgi:hypothetical protein